MKRIAQGDVERRAGDRLEHHGRPIVAAGRRIHSLQANLVCVAVLLFAWRFRVDLDVERSMFWWAVMVGQILVWERSTRLEAGLKRELFQRSEWPTVRACRSARHVVEKRDVAERCVLVLDEHGLKKWIDSCDDSDVALVRSVRWEAVLAVDTNAAKPDWRWTSTGVTAVLAGPVHDGRLAESCLRALGYPTSKGDLLGSTLREDVDEGRGDSVAESGGA